MAIIFGSLTHNDKSKSWLDKWLKENSKYCDKWVIVDDCSVDGTYEEIGNFTPENDIPIMITQTSEPTFKKNENEIRNQLWEKIRKVAKEGDFIFILDSDEIILDKDFKNIINSCKDKYNYVFKKVEMWDKDYYRIDGLWSNYFNRGFIYEDKPWGYYNAGFHHPQIPSYCQKLPVFNTNIRIQHLAYESEETRKSKYDFMMNNPQQSKDITYYHLQSLKDEKVVLRPTNYDYRDNKVLLSFYCDNLYKLPNKTIEYLKILCNENIDIIFIVSDCHYNLINQIQDLDLDVNKINFYVEVVDDEYNDKKSKGAFLKTKLKEKLEHSDYDYIFMVDGHYPLYENFIYTYLNTDKDICVSEDLSVIFMNNQEFLPLINNFWFNIFQGKNENHRFVEFCNLNKKYVWRTGMHGSFPINSNLVSQKN